MLARLLPPGSRTRHVALVVASVLGALAVTQLVLPGTGAGRGTPAAILFEGLVAGAIVAVTAAGIVLVYRTLRVVNFAQAALGIAGATLVFEFVQFTPVPFPVALVLGLLVSGLVGFAVGLVLLRFSRAPRLVLTVFTIVLAALMATDLRQGIMNLPFFPSPEERTISEISGALASRDYLPFAGWEFTIGGFSLPFGFPEVFALELSLITLLALGAFLGYTRFGVAMRAMAENGERASLLGIGVGLLSCIVWALAGVLSGVSQILTGALHTPATAAGYSPGLLLPALTAAVLARMRSIPAAAFAAVLIGVLTQAFNHSFQADPGLVDAALLALIVGGLLSHRNRAGRSEAQAESSSWQATEEPRPIPTPLLEVTAVRVGRVVLVALGLAFVGILPFVTSVQVQNLGGVIALVAIVALSLVVLTGWAGQVSLGQFAFVAVGAVTAAVLTATVGIPFWFAVPIAAATAGGVAVLIGIPALRLPGLLLLVTTFAFAVAVSSVLFEERYFGWLLPDAVERPELFFLDFTDERSMYFLCVGALVLAVTVVVNLRRSRFGRLVIAVRENDTNLRSFGVSAVRTKLMAFAVSGMLAGFAGAIFVHHQGGLSAGSYGVAASINVFILTMFGGVGSVTGALIGAAYFQGISYFFSSQLFQTVVTSGVTLYLLYASPGGVAALLFNARDAVLRIIAQRRHIVVPSLFADYDPEAMERRLIPLGGAPAGVDLATGGSRFALDSELYKGAGERIVDKLGPKRESQDTAALSAAARRAEDLEPAGS